MKNWVGLFLTATIIALMMADPETDELQTCKTDADCPDGYVCEAAGWESICMVDNDD